jgi:hypothetical protein
MPLDKQETKALLLNLFRLSIALTEKRSEDAVQVVSTIIDNFILSKNTEALGDISAVSAYGDEIDIVVQEIREQENLAVSEHVIQTPYSFAKNTNEVKKEPNTTTQQKIDNQNSEHVPENTCVSESEVQSEDESEEDESEEDESEEDESEEDESEVQPEEESEVQPEEDESEVQPKDESEVQPEEEEIELNLEPVRIKKILYWKDSDNGDLYTYLPNDEVGDKIGALIRPIDI